MCGLIRQDWLVCAFAYIFMGLFVCAKFYRISDSVEGCEAIPNHFSIIVEVVNLTETVFSSHLYVVAVIQCAHH